PAAARNRPRQELFRLWIEPHEDVLQVFAGLDVPDRAVRRDVDRVGLAVLAARRCEFLHLPRLRIEVTEIAARVVAVPDGVVLPDRDAPRTRRLVGQLVLLNDQ